MAETGPDLRAAGQPRPGCPLAQVRDRLRRAGLRRTRQRICLGWLLFGKGDRHVTADTLFEEAQRARVPLTLATVYNTLNQFTDVGLVRQIAAEGRKPTSTRTSRTTTTSSSRARTGSWTSPVRP